MRVNAELIITLQSDLCVSSGYSYAGIVDSDVCYDDCGIPYIPAKRIKGCLKETAESVLYSIIDAEQIQKLFGTRGSSTIQGIMLENAYIPNYDDIRAELGALIKANGSVTTQQVLDTFTYIQAQTALDNGGCAKENTLRYTRTVDRISPLTGEKSVFIAKVSFEEDELKIWEKIVAGTRSIGLKRNRGLGQVKCELHLEAASQNKAEQTYSEDTIYRIEYVIRNSSPLMLTENSDSESLNYIKGQAMLGFFAGKYLARKEHSAESEEFNNIFLNGQTVFSNLYPCEVVDGRIRTFYPAPLYINKLKKSGEFLNTEYPLPQIDAGNQPKKLRDTFVYVDENGRIQTKEVDKTVVYHSSHKGRKNGREDDLLFTFEAIKENQQFAGNIVTSGKYAAMLMELLESETISIGKSRTSQYASCTVTKVEISPTEETSINLAKGDEILVTFLSDAIFHNGIDYTVYLEEVRDLVSKDLGIECGAVSSYDSCLEGKMLNGYLGVWNLRRATVPAIKAGSAIALTVAADAIIKCDYVGERNLEGYGAIRVEKLPPRSEAKATYIESVDTTKNVSASIIPVAGKKLVEQIYKEKLRKEIIRCAISKQLIGISASKWSRVALMFKESVAENRNDYTAAYNALYERVNSIKTREDRERIVRYLFENILHSRADKTLQFAAYIKKMAAEPENKSLSQAMEDYRKIRWTENQLDELLNSMWEEYVLTLLTDQKYLGKEGK